MKKIILTLILLHSTSILANNSAWSNEIELGLMLNSGVKQNSHFDSRYTNKFSGLTFSNKFSVESLIDLSKDRLTREKNKTSERYGLKNNTKYNFSETNYLYGELEGQKDRFSAFDYEVNESLGVGKRIFNNDTLKWHLEAGPGGSHRRSTSLNGSRSHQDTIVGHLGTELAYAINQTTELSEDFGFDYGKGIQKTKSTVALKAKAFDAVSFKLSYKIEYNAKLPNTGKFQKHTENTTALTAIYMF